MGGCLQTEFNQNAQDLLLPMGMTSENVAEKYGVSRKQQDMASVSSFCCSDKLDEL